MKWTIIVCIVCLSWNANGQDAWGFTEPGKRYIYKNSAEDLIVEMTNDSSTTDNGITTFHINRALHSSMGEFCAQTLVTGWHYYPIRNEQLYDDFEWKGDSLRLGTITFQKEVTLPPVYASSSYSALNDSLILRRDSFSTRSILNQTDSTVHYSVLHNDSTETVYTMVRSKSFGLVEAPSLKVLLNAGFFHIEENIFSLIGMHDNNQSLGYEVPDFDDWFGFSIGDRFLYEVARESNSSFPWSTDCDGLIEWVIDSIDAEGRRYFIRNDYESNYLSTSERCGVLLKSAFQSLLIHPWAAGSATLRDYYLFSVGLTLDSNGVEHLLITTTEGDCENLFADAPNLNYELTNGIGMTQLSAFSWGDEEYYTLVASETSKGNYGVWPELLGSQHEALKEGLVVYPNPARSELFIEAQDLQLEEMTLTLYTISGTPCWKGRTNPIDLTSFESGIYLLHIEHSEDDLWRRVVIQ